MTAPAGANTSSSGGRTYPVQGRELPSVSTVLNVLDKPGLQVWKSKRIAQAIALDERLRAMAAEDIDGSLYRATRIALDTAPSYEADMGTAVHLAVELWAKFGYRTSTTPGVQPFLDRWLEAVDEFAIHPVSVERTVANLELGYAGTYDAILELDGGDWRCGKWCECPAHTSDVKTGKDVWPDVAMQLAAYTNAPHLWNPPSRAGAGDDTLEPRIPTCTRTGLVIALHADSFRIVPVDLPDAWQAVQACRKAFEWFEVKGYVLGDPLPRRAGFNPW